MSIPDVDELGNTFVFSWHDEKVVAKVERVYQHTRGDVSAEVTFRTTIIDPPALLNHVMCSNLLGPRARSTLAKECHSRYESIDEKQWLSLIETCFEHVVSRSREGEPPEYIVDVVMEQDQDYLLHPLLHRNMITVIFGLGGSLKSTLAAWLIHRVAYGIDADPQNVAILDWESSKQDWSRKMREVAKGLGDDEPAPNVTYRRMHIPIADDIESLYNMGVARNIGLWVIDSGMWACGGNPEKAEDVMAMFRAMRSLGGTILIIAHQNNDENTKRPYGNVMWVNAPRSCVQMQKGQYTINDNEVVVGMTQRKVNYGRPFPPLAYKATFDEQSEYGYTVGDAIRINSTNPLDEADLAENVALPQRIRYVLQRGSMRKDEIIAQLDITPSKEKSVSSTIDRMIRGHKLQRLADGKVGLPDGTFREAKHVSQDEPSQAAASHG